MTALRLWMKSLAIAAVSAMALNCNFVDDGSRRADEKADTAAEKAPSRDVQALARFMNVPRKPISVVWQTRKSATTPNWSLSALLKYAPDDLNAILASSARISGPATIQEEHLAAWFPESLRERYKAAQRGEHGVVATDAALVQPTAFVDSERSPLVDGYVAVFKADGLVYVRLFTFS